MYKSLIALLLLSISFQSCKQKINTQQVTPNDLTGGAISVEGTKFIDSYGRQVLFNGVNYVNKDPGQNYMYADSLLPFAELKKWGFNCIRLGVIWDGVEPTPGKYNESHLDKLEKQVNSATQNGLYVMLDMHQDLYSVQYSDGAPKWATLTDGKPHATGFLWSDAYFASEAIQTAFDNFWANKPASDGVGIQDHYAKMWQHIAKRFAANTTIIGYDIMNEPFNGTKGTMILPVILTEYAKLHAEQTGIILSEQELLGIWTNEELRLKAIASLDSKEKYARVMNAATELCQQFEKTELQAMYQRVGSAMREVDTTHILFLEHAYFSNAGVASGITPVKTKNGTTDPRVAYAPHGYDLLLDTKNNDAQSSDRVEWIFSQLNETSQRINVPVLVGEWGAFGGNSEGSASAAQFIKKQFDKYHFSNTYWHFNPNMYQDLYFKKAFIRPYIEFVAGTLKTCEMNYETGVFTCSWDESPSVKAPTVIFISDFTNLIKESIKLAPESSNTVVQSTENSNSGYIIIPANDKSEERTIEFKLNMDQSSISIDKKSN